MPGKDEIKYAGEILYEKKTVFPPELIGVLIKAYAVRSGEESNFLDAITANEYIKSLDKIIESLPVNSDEKNYYLAIKGIAIDAYNSRKHIRVKEKELYARVERDRTNTIGTLDDIITWKNNILRYIPVGGTSLAEITQNMENGISWYDISDTIRVGFYVWLIAEGIIQIGGRLARNPINKRYDKQEDAITRWSKRNRKKIYETAEKMARIAYKKYIKHEDKHDEETTAEKQSKKEPYMNGLHEHPFLEEDNINKKIKNIWRKFRRIRK
ncbi:MAG: hypothetical protein KQA33_01390 [Candidatus Aenigmarchaeota archaeon]|nr:hypothetical protein [Candidatus Aenigmarchaeota archaeon]